MKTKRARQKPATSLAKHGITAVATRHEGATNGKKGTKPAEPARIGRQTLLTPALQERIVGAIRSGAYNETAAAYANIAEKTFYNWLTRGREDAEAGIEPEDSIHLQFLQAIEKAQADAEIENLLVVRGAAIGKPSKEGVPGEAQDWKAAAWYLERKHPDRYGRRIVQIPDPQGGESKKGKGDRKPQYFRFGGQIIEF